MGKEDRGGGVQDDDWVGGWWGYPDSGADDASSGAQVGVAGVGRRYEGRQAPVRRGTKGGWWRGGERELWSRKREREGRRRGEGGRRRGEGRGRKRRRGGGGGEGGGRGEEKRRERRGRGGRGEGRRGGGGGVEGRLAAWPRTRAGGDGAREGGGGEGNRPLRLRGLRHLRRAAPPSSSATHRPSRSRRPQPRRPHRPQQPSYLRGARKAGMSPGNAAGMIIGLSGA